jgi:N-acetyl sugar amidotransferase
LIQDIGKNNLFESFKMKNCASCGLPETYETIEFDVENVCNICDQQKYKQNNIDWIERKKMFKTMIEEYRGKYDYDCIVPFSGGKDSTFTLYHLVKEYKVKPLVVQFNHGFMRPTLLENNERTFKRLGVDVISFTPNWKVVKRLMREALIRKGDFCWHCHTGIFSYPMHLAVKFAVPLVLWGEPSSEYTAYYDYKDNKVEEVDETRFNRFVNLGITAEDMRGMIDKDFDLDIRDLIPYTYPALRDLKRLRYRSVCLGSFIPWDVRTQSKLIMEELGWQGDEVEGMPPGLYTYEKIECAMQGVRDYLKFLKRGYSRVTQMTAIDIRNGRLTKDEADKLIKDWEGKKPPSLEIFLEFLEMTEEEFNEIVAKLVVPPYEPDFHDIKWGKRTADFDRWYREPKA